MCSSARPEQTGRTRLQSPPEEATKCRGIIIKVENDSLPSQARVDPPKAGRQFIILLRRHII